MLYNVIVMLSLEKVKVLIMDFTLGWIPPENEDKTSFYFLFRQRNLLVKKVDKGYAMPDSEDIAYLGYNFTDKLYIGSIDDYSCYTASYPEDGLIPEGMEFLGLRELYGQIDESMLKAAFRAVQIVAWDETHRFCGACGEATVRETHEHARVCHKCRQVFYPRLSPAVIVAVTKGDKLLLARNVNFPAGRYSVLAGFVEAGETMEECIKREIKEEVGIEVKNIKYFGSQSWPFPNSLMIGFTAEHESGELKADNIEIADAGWFSVKELPDIPGSISISRELIDWFMEKHRK